MVTRIYCHMRCLQEEVSYEFNICDHLAKISSGNTCIFKYINHCKELQNAMDWLGDAEEMVRSLYASVVVDQVEIREMKERGRIDLVMRTKDRPD